MIERNDHSNKVYCKFMEASRGAAARRSGTVKPGSMDWLWVRSLEEMKYLLMMKYNNLYFHFFALVSWQSAALSSATQHTIASRIRQKVGNGVA